MGGFKNINEGTSRDVDFDLSKGRMALVQQESEKYTQLAQAVQQYKQAMQEANETEQRGEYVSMDGSNVAVRADEAIERANALKEMLTQYSIGVKSGGSPEEVLSGIVNHFGEQLQAYDGLEENLRNILTGENGQSINPVEADAKYNELDAFIDECQDKIDNAKEQAEQARQDAASGLADASTQLGENYTEASVNAAIAQIEQLSGPLDAAQKALLQSTPSLIEEIGNAAKTGDAGTIQSAIDSAFDGVDLESIGSDVTAGYAEGERAAIPEVESASGEVADASVDAMQTAADVHSPSGRTKPIGQGITQGVAEGMKDTSSIGPAAEAVAAAVQAAIASALSSEDGSEGESLGAALLGGVAEGASSGSSGIATALTSAVQSAAKSAGSTASSSGRSIGTNLMSGIRSGISSMVSSISAAAAAAVRSAIAAAKAAASIHSPSGVMRDEVGVQLMRGMEVGVVNRVPATIQVIKESVGGVLSGAAQVVNQGGIPTPALPIPAPAGISFDYEALAEANAARPVVLNMSGKQIARATRDEAARQQAVRVSQINAGYGGK